MRRLRKLIIFIIVVGLAYTIFDSLYLSLRSLNVDVVEVKSDQIPASFNNSKIMVFSDIYSDSENLDKLKDYVDDYKPDLIVFLGNLLNEEALIDIELEATFKGMKAPLGKYAVSSLDDYNANESIKQFLTSTDFRIVDTGLIPIHRYTEEPIYLALYSAVDNNDMRSALKKNLDTDTYTIGLIHDPSLIKGLEVNGVDMWVAGKTNHGKINVPLIGSLLYRGEPTKKVQDLNDIPLHLTSGVGTDTPRVRLFSKPNIIILNLKSSS